MKNHLQFAFRPIAIPTLRTLMINSRRKNNRIIPEFALRSVVYPIPSLVDLPLNAFLRVVTPPPTHTRKVRTKKSRRGQFVKDHIVIPHHNNFSRNHPQFASHLIVTPQIYPVMNTNPSQTMRTKIDHLQFVSHLIAIPIPRMMKI
jgi:hypothetical protein